MSHQARQVIVPATRLSKVFRSYNDTLVRYLLLRTGSREEALEIAQEAYMRILGRSDMGRISDLESYLFQTAKNIHIDRIRNASLGHKAVARVGHEMAFGGARDEASDIGPADEADLRDTVRVLIAALEELPAKCREAFVKYKFDGASYALIAQDMGLTESMIRKYVLRGLKHCQERLNHQVDVTGER